jgi:tetratricopeptide (TPR) repeat protein
VTDLQRERDFLLQSIRDLDAERDAGDIDEADYQSLREEYTARAAEVMRALEEPAAANESRATRFSALPWVVGILAFAVLAGLLIASSLGERTVDQPVTGGVTPTTDPRLAEARRLVQDGKAADAVKLYDEILDDRPDQPEALAYRGWLVRLAGLTDQGLAYIDRAIAADPDYADAHFFRGMILWKDKNDLQNGIAEMRTFLASNPPPDMVPMVQQSLRQMLQQAATTTSTP